MSLDRASLGVGTGVGLVALLVSLTACQKPSTPSAEASERSAPSATLHGSSPESLPESSAQPSGFSQEQFAGWFRDLSEPDQYFFSDNHISNETSYLEVTPILERLRRKGVAYLGVGPEQNFTYIALIEPEMSFIVDIRRDNALLHLLYKSCFAEATSRAHFLSLLVGREALAADPPDPEANVSSVLAYVDRAPRDAAVFTSIHKRLVARIAEGIALTAKDHERLGVIHRAFFDAGLGIRFELHHANGRGYPTLGELLVAKDPRGVAHSFVASERAFRTLQRLHRENRIVPIVGDFSGSHALKAIAKQLAERQLNVAAFYVSNVEQYLLTAPQWKAWVDNVQALPRSSESVFIRAYLDQGQRHPRQRPRQRSVTVAQPLARFPTGTRPPANFYQITTQEVLD